MKNLLILSLFVGMFYVVGSTIVQISKMNAGVAAEIILKKPTNKGPFLDEKRARDFVKGFEGI